MWDRTQCGAEYLQAPQLSDSWRHQYDELSRVEARVHGVDFAPNRGPLLCYFVQEQRQTANKSTAAEGRRRPKAAFQPFDFTNPNHITGLNNLSASSPGAFLSGSPSRFLLP